MLKPKGDECADRKDQPRELRWNSSACKDHPNSDAHESIAQNASEESLLEGQIHFCFGDACCYATMSSLKETTSRNQKYKRQCARCIGGVRDQKVPPYIIKGEPASGPGGENHAVAR